MLFVIPIHNLSFISAFDNVCKKFDCSPDLNKTFKFVKNSFQLLK